MPDYKDLITQELAQIERVGMDKLLDYLNESDYFTAPASRQYHESSEGGLAYHSWKVFRLLTHKVRMYKLQVPEDSTRIVGLLHDVCKIDFYVRGLKWYKDATTNNQWRQREEWQIKDCFPIGHGEKSVINIQKYVALTDQEILMIRWHMGAFDSATNSFEGGIAFRNAIEACPAIIAVACAPLN